MIIDKPGKYRLTKDWSSMGAGSISHCPAGTVLTVTQVDRAGHKVIGPEMFDWAPWEIPAEEINEEIPRRA